MLKSILNNVEYVALVMNVLIFIAVCCQRPLQTGKVLYWLGAMILVFGVCKMKG